jgi:hypothetical protein
MDEGGALIYSKIEAVGDQNGGLVNDDEFIQSGHDDH